MIKYVHPPVGWPRFQKSTKIFMRAVFYESYGILEWDSVLSQAVNPLCPSTMKYTKQIMKNTKEKLGI